MLTEIGPKRDPATLKLFLSNMERLLHAKAHGYDFRSRNTRGQGGRCQMHSLATDSPGTGRKKDPLTGTRTVVPGPRAAAGAAPSSVGAHAAAVRGRSFLSEQLGEAQELISATATHPASPVCA